MFVQLEFAPESGDLQRLTTPSVLAAFSSILYLCFFFLNFDLTHPEAAFVQVCDEVSSLDFTQGEEPGGFFDELAALGVQALCTSMYESQRLQQIVNLLRVKDAGVLHAAVGCLYATPPKYITKEIVLKILTLLDSIFHPHAGRCICSWRL